MDKLGTISTSSNLDSTKIKAVLADDQLRVSGQRFGLRGMQERALGIGADIRISSDEKGTLIYLQKDM